jgi:predicted N-acetyltransferase YhbS
MTSIECDVFNFALFSEPAPVCLREERPVDAPAREALLDAALGSGRLRKTCERLRVGRRPVEGLALVATQGERLVGSLRLWSVQAGDRSALLLGPLCVAADQRLLGVGRRLIAEGLFRAVRRGHGAVILVGDAPYYGRFGFERSLVRDLRMPGPVELDRFLGLELVPGALAGATGDVLAAAAAPESSRETSLKLRAA